MLSSTKAHKPAKDETNCDSNVVKMGEVPRGDFITLHA
jgi:hypothetical protein